MQERAQEDAACAPNASTTATATTIESLSFRGPWAWDRPALFPPIRLDAMTDANDSSYDTSSRGPAVLAVTSATLVACTTFVVFRLISRFGIVRKPGYDDYFIILAWILAFGTSFSICYGTSVGLGRHMRTIPQEWESPMKKTAYVFSVLYVGNHYLPAFDLY